MSKQFKLYNMATGETVIPLEWQQQLKVGDCYFQRDIVDIYGKLEKKHSKGFFLAHAFSVGCPEGEHGLVCIASVTKKISKEEFERQVAKLNQQ